MSRRADKIRVEAAAMRKSLEDQGMCQADALAQEAGFLMGVIEGLCVQLDRHEGIGLKASKGCTLAEVTDANGNPFTVEYEYEPGSPGNTSGPPERCYPDEPASLMITAVYIAGELIETDVFSDAVIERWEQELCEKQILADEEEAASMQADFWRDRQIDEELESKGM